MTGALHVNLESFPLCYKQGPNVVGPSVPDGLPYTCMRTANFYFLAMYNLYKLLSIKGQPNLTCFFL